MKKTLLLVLASALAIGVNATMPMSSPTATGGGTGTIKHVQARIGNVAKVEKLGNGIMKKTTVTPNGRAIRHIESNVSTKGINPFIKKTAKNAALPEGMLLWESFEGYDSTVEGWLPEGWSVISKGDPDLEPGAKWGVERADPNNYMPASPDGDYYMAIGFSYESLEQDEWLMLPMVKPEGQEELKFQLYTAPLFFYDINNINWETYEWTADPVLVGDVTVQVKVGDGDWTPIWSMMDQFKDMSLKDLMSYGQFDTYSVSLAEYVGQDVEIAFNYKAKDANTVLIDCVSVGLPSLEGVSYTVPFETLYWGFDSSENWAALNLKVAQYPVCAPIEFYNNRGADASYSWLYHDPITNEMEVSEDQDVLNVTYLPDYSSEFTRRNNMYYPPVLNATASGASDASYVMPVDYMQTGGKPEFEVGSSGAKSLMTFGMLPFCLQNDSYGYLTIDAPSVGDYALPVFGYNCNTDKYWLDYTLNGEKPSEGDAVKMMAIINFIYPPSAPLVVSGVHVNALGEMSENAELKIEIIACSDEYVPLDEVMASATCKYSEMKKYDGDLPYQMLNIPFVFDKPVVIDNSKTAYIVKLSGFNSEEVETFIPIQSMKPNESYLCHGWIEKWIKIDSDEFRVSYSPMANVTGQYGECYNAFAINLDAYFPWLECETEKVSVPSDGTPVEVRLGSYYDGSELTVSELTGLETRVEGRYNECVLTLKHNEADVIIDGEIEITAPGVRKVIKVDETTTGITDVNAATGHGEVIGVYRIDGTQIEAAKATNGIFIVKYSDGTVSKAVLK